ncbi:MAG TPA: hypothetical protein VJ963_05410 [Bacteroidales bacterium]|nr:hypothetical protein [Bacteroidales bacterium]
MAFVFATLLILLLVFGYYKAGKQISYLPALKAGLFKTGSDTKSTIELKGVGYILDASKSGDIKVKTPDGSLILSGLKFYSEYRGTKPKIGLDSVTVQLRNDSTLSISGKGAFGTKVGLTLTVPSHRSRLDVSVRTRYSRDVKIDRESLIAGFGVPVSKIYLKNRKEVSGNFSSQYWLQRQGVRFGKGERSALVYNCQEVSSLQLDVNRRHLFINLDYYLDHPFIHYPYQKDAGGRWKDLSRSEYHGDNVTKRTFAIHFDVPEEIPRLKLTPYGYLAAYVFTEHADGGTLKSNRAAYFGAEDISDINKAVGGFAAHRIPVTKSVFFFNPDSANYVSVRDDPQFPAFRNFLDHLNATGLYDLCLHTPENLNSTRERMEESVSYMHGRYNTSTWIDHGFYNGKINRECFVADGLDPTKVLYGADLWRKYNTRYFWSPAVEEMHTYSLKDNLMHLKFYDVAVKLWSRYLSPKELTEMSFRYALINLIKRLGEKNELDCFLPGKGSSYPTPIAWQNKTISGDFYSWVTDDFYKDFKDMDQKSLDHEKKLLERMISEWGIYINHGYYVRYGSGHGVINKKDGKMVINPYFDRMLAIMSDMRDRGDLELVTVRGLLDYWVLLRKVSFDYLPDGKIIVCNNNDKPVNGLSLAVDGSGILVDGRVPEMKKAGEDTVFWFDIPAGDRAEISIAAP